MRQLHFLIPALVAVAVMATPTAAEAQKGDSNTLTAEEIAEHPDVAKAYDAIQRLRPKWLRTRPTGNTRGTDGSPFSNKKEPAVYVNENPWTGGLADLKNLPAADILEMKYMSGTQAVARYGNGHEYGAIFITLRR